MSKKRKIIISVIFVLLIVVSVFTFTYAFFVGRTDEVDIGTDSGMLDVSYTVTNFGDDSGSDAMSILPSSSKEGGIKASATAKINDDSVEALFNLYITPTTIDSELAISALKWEVDILEDVDDTDNYDWVVADTIRGDFSDAVEGEAIKIVDGHELTTDLDSFNIYIWLDSSLLTEPIVNKRFVATLSADTVNITGDL